MKKLKMLFSAGVLVALAFGCSTTASKESLLSSAGFKAVPANTPQTEAHLKSLPHGKITPVQRDGTVYYTFPDPKNKILYVGQEEQYRRYQNLRYQKQLANEQLAASQAFYDGPWGAWGAWDAGWAVRY